jgi:transposase
LLRNNDNLTDRAKERLEEALEINKPLASAYYLKEELKLLWMQVSLEKALEFLESWVAKAYETGLFKLREFANTLSP